MMLISQRLRNLITVAPYNQPGSFRVILGLGFWDAALGRDTRLTLVTSLRLISPVTNRSTVKVVG